MNLQSLGKQIMLNFPTEIKKESAFSQNWITLNAKNANGIFFSERRKYDF